MDVWRILCAMEAVVILLLMWTNGQSYRHGVWDGANNPTIPPVKRALEYLAKQGWCK